MEVQSTGNLQVFLLASGKLKMLDGGQIIETTLLHPAACPFCDQEPETIDHLLLGCVLARQVWAVIMDNWGKPHWTPEPEAELVRWWTSLNIEKTKRKETWTMITLVAWTLWKHRNDIMFNGA